MRIFGANMTKSMVAALLVVSVILMVLPGNAAAQGGRTNIQDLIVNGGFEGGFQEEFGVGYGWGGFSNGNAVVGWNFDDWGAVVFRGKFAQRIEIKNAVEPDRYAGIYQTINVVPGQQYKLTINGLIRSEEGSIEKSDYGYRLQYAVDDEGGVAWELLDHDAWRELPWDEQPMTLADGQSYQMQTFDATLTAKTDKLTIFIRGWKKWADNGAGVFDLDEISVIGLAPDGFQAPVAPQAASVNAAVVEPAAEASTEADASAVSETAPEQPADEFAPEAQAQTEVAEAPESVAEQAPAKGSSGVVMAAPANTIPDSSVTPLPATGYGEDSSVWYVMVIGLIVLLALIGSAVAATIRRRSLAE
ncbi:MAG: hypothetical protein D6768_03075 [Chloroflexi bacterium]|nr:MAG: hypothetical protein D6768_03075 [Chloroflexota bacterium]